MFKQFFILFFLIISLSFNIHSQQDWDLGIRLGASNYLGDIGGKEKIRRNFVLDMKLKQTSLVGGVFLRYKIDKNWSLNAQVNYGRIRGDDALSTNLGRMWRNLRFKNDIIELSGRGEYYFYEDADFGNSGKYNTELKAFLHGGLTGFYHNPKGSLNGTSWTSLQPLQTEGVKYNKIGLGIPVGLGLVVTIKRDHRIGLDFSWTTTFTDYLDDISTVYYDPSNMGSSAEALANQSAQVTPEEQIYNFMPGEKRGDPTHNDTYMFTTVTYSYYLHESNKNKFFKNKRKGRPRPMRRTGRRVIKSKF